MSSDRAEAIDPLPDAVAPASIEVSGDLAAIVAAFVAATEEELDAVITDGLGHFGRVLDMDLATVLVFDGNRHVYRVEHQWSGPAVQADPGFLGLDIDVSFRWLHRKLEHEEPFLVSRLDDWPAEAEAERATCVQVGIKSVLWVPFQAGEDIKGYLAYNTIREERLWDDLAVERLRLFGGIIGGALQRRRTERALKELRRFEGLITTLSSDLLRVQSGAIDDRIELALKEVGTCLGIERAFVVQFAGGREPEVGVTHGWFAEGTSPDPFLLSAPFQQVCPWAAAQLLGNRPIVCRDVEQLPPEASAELRYVRGAGLRSGVLTPLANATDVVGALIVDSYRTRDWSDELVQRLRLVSEIFANALTRRLQWEVLCRSYQEIERLQRQLEAENTYLRQEIELRHRHEEIIGQSPAIRAVLGQVEQVAGTGASVLVSGETGTGKELMAQAIHRLSPRRKRAMVTVSCAALPGTLIEAELFGREKGAYTGALTKQPGRFEIADGSTLFLDEVGELPPEVQTKLLRVLQAGEFERVGSPATRRVDVRLVAATNRDLGRLVKEGRFREDLYYRLNVFPIGVPPLRERTGDIPALVWAFVQEFGARMGKTVETIPRRSMQALQRYPWPGNVRELRNVIERAMILTHGERLQVQVPSSDVGGDETTGMAMADMERHHILATLARTGWRVRGTGGAAELLELKPSTLESRMKKLGIRRPC